MGVPFFWGILTKDSDYAFESYKLLQLFSKSRLFKKRI
jgi:hypothetical protein